MSILDINKFKKTSFKYLLFSIFCGIFAFIYEIFSHNVYSNNMIFAFLIPLIMGTIMFYLIYITNWNKYIDYFSYNLYNASIATFTIGSIIKGVLEIYGTTNSLSNTYFVVGFILLVLSILSIIIEVIKKYD